MYHGGEPSSDVRSPDDDDGDVSNNDRVERSVAVTATAVAAAVA